MTVAAIVAAATIALTGSGAGQPLPTGTEGFPDGLPPKVHTFMSLTEIRALHFLDQRIRLGDRIYGPREDAAYWTEMRVFNDRNAQVKWHVMTHQGDFMIDWTSRCILSGMKGGPTKIRCRQWQNDWMG